MKVILMTIFLLGGVFFFVVGTIGILRFRDLFTRAHSAAKCDTLGAVLCLMALMIYSGWGFTSFKLLLVIVFLWITNPTATHLISKAAYIQWKEKTSNSQK
ncbi:monovalent cation/H(+) antiporter subunit G [Marinisporobacter balticus]|uniref:Multisubunit sodium/proton antiporter MrpG subunit n=1 Tax=Marinisporobacter balticus TaxID=2018667 RepID=A0A4R2KRA7_9FIRM|nr:monovalent cation/H(+) antiporter subunit G [Marinisporobacter balticus]TCO72668.1 multisubunit sodium/proton antiporter MrpG subunit [Marinisporobacter balticus]